MSNWHLKLGSLGAAICLAVFVNYFFAPAELGTSVVQLVAPIEIRNVPDNKSLIWPGTRQVELTVQGPSLFLSKVALSPPVVKVSVPEGASKSFTAHLSVDNVGLPATVRLLGIKPADLEFGLDDIVERTLPVVVPQLGVLSQDYKLEKVAVEPAEVKLRGPARELKDATTVETNPINLASIDSSRSLQLDLRTPWDLVQPEVRSVKVDVVVSEAMSEVSFSSIPVQLDVQAEALKSRNPRLLQKGVSVVLKGARKKLRDVRRDDLNVQAVVSSDQLDPDSVELTIDPLPGVNSAIISPRRVSLALDPLPTPTPKAAGKKGKS